MEALNDWKEEKRSAYLYLIMAKVEPNLLRKKLFIDLAEAAESQAVIWGQKITTDGGVVPEKYIPDFRTNIVTQLIKIFGTKRLRYILSAMKVRGMSIYTDKDAHHPMPTSPLNLERQHQTLNIGGNLRAAVFGVNDGLISNMSLLLGIAGANAPHSFIVLSGIAGLLAGAVSMAAGEYVSVRSQRELFEYQIELERNELLLYPKEEAYELTLIYRARGLPEQEARQLSELIIRNPENALATLAREELGLNPSELSSPWGAAISSFCSFAVGAFIPLLPFLFNFGDWNLPLTILLTGLSLFLVGTTISLFTNNNAIKSGLRMLLIGAAAGTFTFFVGKMLGVALS